MFTDLAGYTALTERDSSAALDLVQMARELHETILMDEDPTPFQYDPELAN